ncbi:hypothetical protein ACSBL2_18860 [Pedobacter sp. AW31-3R]|uniref:hypothetical protein n=1 Tax=Pedobacter sp. AW31-3R TaxID=3445781 RepID=UPI003F9F0BAE
MENINIKAAFLAVILLMFTQHYYVRQPGSIMSPVAAIAIGVIGILIFFAYFFVVKITAYASSTGIYPHIGFRIVLPFMVFLIIAWLIYAGVSIKPFGNTRDYLNILKQFFVTHGLFIAICTLAIGLTISYPAPKEVITQPSSLRSNLNFLVIAIAVFFAMVFLFYITNKIKQPAFDEKYNSYKPLDELPFSANNQITRLLETSEYTHLEQPYLLPNAHQVIIMSNHRSNDKQKPVQMIWRLNKDGDIIEKIEDNELTNDNFYPLIAQDGLFTDYDGKEVITWIFNGERERKNKNNIQLQDDWVIDSLKEDSNLKMVYFEKSSEFHCRNSDTLRYNGMKYYELKSNNEMLLFKLNSTYTEGDLYGDCQERRLDYYQSEQLNFSLLRVNAQEFYIIKHKKEKP